jgi:hypothetical protein
VFLHAISGNEYNAPSQEQVIVELPGRATIDFVNRTTRLGSVALDSFF